MSVDDGTTVLTRLRTAIVEDYCSLNPLCGQIEGADREEMERHSLGSRVTHWIQVVLMGVLVVTGYTIWTGNYGPLNVGIWDGYYVSFGLHMWAGILILAVTIVLFPFYHVFVDDHRQLAELADVSLGVDVGLAFLGLRDYPENYHDGRRAWDASAGDWIVGHPAQKTFFWWITILTGAIALTGFGMYREMAVDPAWWVQLLGFPAAVLALETLKQLHLVLSGVIVGMVLFHVYMSVLPSNWDILRSMVTGDLSAYVIADSAAEEDSAEEETTR